MSAPQRNMVQRRIDPSIGLVLEVRVHAPLDAVVPEDADSNEIARMVAPELADVILRVRDALSELLMGLASRGLAVRGSLTLGGETTRLGE